MFESCYPCHNKKKPSSHKRRLFVLESIQTKKLNHKLIADVQKHGIIISERNERRYPKMLCNTVNVMSYEYSYEYSEFMSFERSFISHTPRQAKTDHVQMRCVF